MRVMFEPWFVNHKVDMVLAGHVHSYERSVNFSLPNTISFCINFLLCCLMDLLTCLNLLQERVSNVQYNITNGLSSPVKNHSAPVYITIGDGGNIEGIADR